MKKILALFICILIIQSTPIFANPFTGKKDSPTPVRQTQASQTILNIQRVLTEKLGLYISSWKDERNLTVLFTIIGLSFLYGFIHALGPGHRKTIVFSFYIARKAKPIEPFITGSILAGFHAGTAIILMLIFKGVSGAISVSSNNTMIYMEGITFLILIALAIYGIIDSIQDFRAKHKHHNEKLKLSAILLSGLYPCPAAMLVLILSINLNVLALGMFAVLAMSIGMSIPIIASGYLAWAGRAGIFYKIKNQEATIRIISFIVQLTGYTILLLISISISLPFILGLLRKL